MTPAGTRVAYTITYLGMREDPGLAEPQFPAGCRLEEAVAPPVWYFLSLYSAVGKAYAWQDRLEEPEDDVAAFIGNPDVELWTLSGGGWPKGFFVLDFREPARCDLAYFGLVPEAVGRGLGRPLLQAAIAKGWARPSTGWMTVNTCTLDHPRALGLYQSMGFRKRYTQDHNRVLTHDHHAG
ncbi:MAG: GNAT family N-acetyltransferase [Pseudomonadota bacterium]